MSYHGPETFVLIYVNVPKEPLHDVYQEIMKDPVKVRKTRLDILFSAARFIGTLSHAAFSWNLAWPNVSP